MLSVDALGSGHRHLDAVRNPAFEPGSFDMVIDVVGGPVPGPG